MNKVEDILNNPKKSIRKLSQTLMLAMVFMFAYNIVDTIFVAGISVEALTAVGFFTPIFMLITAIGQGLGVGMSTAMSRSIGAKDTPQASNIALHSVLITILISILFIIITFFGLKELMLFIGAESVIDLTMAYGSITFIFAFVFLFDFLFSSILRAEGDMKRSTIIMAIGCILNACMDPIFIYLLGFGVGGAAISSVLASLISIIIAYYWIFIKKDMHVQIHLNHFKFSKSILKEIFNVGIPATLEGLAMNITIIIINYMLIIVGGSLAVAAFTAGYKIIMVSMVPAMSVEGALLTIAGMNFGAENKENIKIIYHYAIKFSTVIAIVLAVILFVFSNNLATLFAHDINLINEISTFIKILSVGTIAIPIGLCSTAMFQAKGNGTISLSLVIIRDIIFLVIFGAILGFILNLGAVGVYLGITIGYILSGIISYIAFEIYYNRRILR